MAKRKEDVMLEISKMIDQLEPTLLEIGILPSMIATSRKHLTDPEEKMERINHAKHWLQSLINNEVKKYQAALAYHTPEEWKMLDLMDSTEQTEHIILRDAKKDLVKKWRFDRPSLLKAERKKNVRKGN